MCPKTGVCWSKNTVFSPFWWVKIFTFAIGQGWGGWLPPPPPLTMSLTVKYPWFFTTPLISLSIVIFIMIIIIIIYHYLSIYHFLLMRNEGVGVGAGAGTPRSAQRPHSSRWQPLWSSTTSLLCLLVAAVLLITKFGIITHRSFSCPFLWIDCRFYCQKHPISCCLLSLFVILLFRCEGQFNHQQYKSITSLFEKNVLRIHSTFIRRIWNILSCLQRLLHVETD